MFSFKFCESFKNNFYNRTPPVAASVSSRYILGSSRVKKIALYYPNVLNYFQPVQLFSKKKHFKEKFDVTKIYNVIDLLYVKSFFEFFSCFDYFYEKDLLVHSEYAEFP